MSVHVSATLRCNMGCDYCYEEPGRQYDQAQIDSEYDIEAIMGRLKQFKQRYPGQTPGLHGGEPLLMRDEHIERILKWTHEEYDLEEQKKNTHIQTNGTLITDEHIEMFEKYRVNVGISCDGPGDLNGLRYARSEMDGEQRDITDSMTEKTLNSIERVADSDASMGIIVVLTKQNAGDDEKLENLLSWMDSLQERGVSGHFNPAIPYEDVQADESLTPTRLKEVYLRTWEWMKAEPYRNWGPMNDMQDNLIGNSLRNCVENKCDVFNAGAAKIATGDGNTTGCGKTWGTVGDGAAFLQGDSNGSEYNNTEERYEMLKQVPGPHTEGEEDHGGCKGCQFWNVCQGGCPSSGLDYDYRNRTRWCEAKYAVLDAIKHDMKAMMTGMRMITDAPWDAPIADLAASGQLDIKPFAGMHQSQVSRDATKPSVSGARHDENSVLSQSLQNADFDTKRDAYIEKYGEENVTADPETGSIHGDISH
ncbi:radical SAM protein [Halomonas sp.]|uniref:radical SAM protein n=1 Tax=Halomonas sp. TaxID=1486246 RepID=UPI003562B71B